MKKDKILFLVTNIDWINDLKTEGITNFVYPLVSFCVGIPDTFFISDIKEENSYIYINRVLDSKSIDLLKDILSSLPKNIKGIIFDDPGLINVLKNYNLEKVLFLSHFNTNYRSINYYFDYVDEVVVSTDITEEEIDEIISKAKKKVSLYTFGLISGMYSRRTLLTSHSKHYNIPYENKKLLKNSDKEFLAYENEFGTVLYHLPYFNGSRLINKDAKYYLYFPLFLNKEDALKCLNNDFSNIKYDYGFLDTKTIYKVKGDK